MKPNYTILGPCPCQSCGLPVWWARSRTRLCGRVVPGLAWWREATGRKHSCQSNVKAA